MMKIYLKAGLTLVKQGLLELMHLIFILSIGVLAYYLIRNLPIDDMIAIALSVGAGLLAAYQIYGASAVVALASMEASKINSDPFENDMDPMYSQDPGNIYFNND